MLVLRLHVRLLLALAFVGLTFGQHSHGDPSELLAAARSSALHEDGHVHDEHRVHDDSDDHRRHGHGATTKEDLNCTSGEEPRRDLHGDWFCYGGGSSGTGEAWLASILSIFVISLCSLLGIIIIPFMQQIFYQHLLQFLVALAVGTLAGDALLHLLPHAVLHALVLDHERKEELEKAFYMRGFFALMAFILFFILEKFINIGGEWRNRRLRQKRKLKAATEAEKTASGCGSTDDPQKGVGRREDSQWQPRLHVVRSGHRTSERAVGEPVCKNKYSSYSAKDVEREERLQEAAATSTAASLPSAEERAPMLSNLAVTDETSDMSKNGGRKPSSPPTSENGSGKVMNDKKTSSCKWKDFQFNVSQEQTSTAAATDVVFIREHENQHHGHSHAHTHVHSKPDSISSVAWMVIFGDGLHNFADGLAIGTAYTQGTVFGIANSVAIFCHELPHELGDFAMLLKAGMTVKQAAFYNFVSSLTAFLGMIVGIFLGNVPELASWILAGTAGIFLYVALVDMVPEMSSGHSHPYVEESHLDPHLMELALQVSGMVAGILIMLVLAAYEHELAESLSSY